LKKKKKTVSKADALKSEWAERHLLIPLMLSRTTFLKDEACGQNRQLIFYLKQSVVYLYRWREDPSGTFPEVLCRPGMVLDAVPFFPPPGPPRLGTLTGMAA
jgi:hypothetical protein